MNTLAWSLRRELWENRSVWVAPTVVAAVALFGASVGGALRLRKMPATAYRAAFTMPYGAVAAAVMLTGFIVSAFYCLDALSSERRDRSILFWKSLPVSDRTTVLSKAAIPLVVQPLLSFLLGLVMQCALVVVATLALLAHGRDPGVLWGRLPFPQMWIVMFYGLVAHTLWYAPLYAWLLLVSAWARRLTAVWAVLPVLALLVLERAFGSSHFAKLLGYRLRGAMLEAFDADAAKVPAKRLSDLDPIGFLTTPGLWLGLAFAAACLVVAVHLRRKREPN